MDDADEALGLVLGSRYVVAYSIWTLNEGFELSNSLDQTLMRIQSSVGLICKKIP